ncbi:MAG: hypothetical protein IJD92_04870 [Bacilli bacterium]|nr:hypothetical protein [Bacilli bacterium]
MYLEYLKEYNVSEEEIKDIINTYDNELLKNLNFSKKNVKEIIKYLLEFGVEDIYNVIKNRIDLFFLPLSLVKQNFTKLDKNMLVYLLNNSIDDLINYNI